MKVERKTALTPTLSHGERETATALTPALSPPFQTLREREKVERLTQVHRGIHHHRRFGGTLVNSKRQRRAGGFV